MSSSRLLLASSAAVAAIGFACPASAEVDAAIAERLKRIEAQLAAQAQRLEQQEQRLMQQEQLIQSQSLEIHGLHSQRDQLLEDIRAGHALAVDAESPSSTAVAAAAPQAGPTPDEIPSRPVGEAPPPAEHQIREVAAVPESAGVLTPRGQLVIDPSFEYVRTSNNRLVFRGIAIVPGVQLGVIVDKEHNMLAADRNALHRRKARCNRADFVPAECQGPGGQPRCMLPTALVCLLRVDGGRRHAGGQCECKRAHQPDGKLRQEFGLLHRFSP